MTFNDFVQNQPDGKPYAHMNFDKQFKWDAKGENFQLVQDRTCVNTTVCQKACATEIMTFLKIYQPITKRFRIDLRCD